MDDDPVFVELKESFKRCREKIRKQMKNEDFVVTTITWELIWAEMRNTYSWKVSSRVKKQLKCWFQLWKEFPLEMDPNSRSIPQMKDELYKVQPGDLWMDCGRPHLSESAIRTESSVTKTESSTLSIDSVVESTKGHLKGEGGTHDEKRESCESCISDIPSLDVHKTPGSAETDYDDFPLTKPWWSGMLASPTQSSPVKAASTGCASPKSPALESVTSKRCRDANSSIQVECKPEQRPSCSTPKRQLTENSFFLHRGNVVYKTGTQKMKERSNQGREIEPIKQRGSLRRGRPLHTRTREPKRRPLNRKPKIQSKRESLLSGKTPKKLSFPPEDYVYQKGDWVVHSIMSSVSTTEDLKVALRERGYELKHIIKRECTLPQKWICSLIASADRTHIITSENIWLKGWEVDFVCDEEDISPFLVE